tara:strand:- start:88 stop:474 length:387 start_codon:yes stop_codon:yes gene_type:complete
MAHFAEIDETNTVVQVVVVNNDVMTIDDVENEQKGIDFLNELFPDSKTWVQTSYNANFRYNYAALGSTYDAENNAFIPPKNFPSYELDTTTFRWKAPIPNPNPNATEPPFYRWDEDTTSWVEIEFTDE